jgi:geranylgeranyl reductase family protein
VSTDALIIGAGPAGSAAAIAAAQRGLRVALVDRHDFPRDKTCGDALIPDALQALADLGLRDRIARIAHQIGSVRIYSPSGAWTTLEGECACVPRLVFDESLCDAAVERGVRFVPHLRALAPIVERGVVAGARFESATRQIVEMRAATTILATGAASDVLARFEMCERSKPSATAARMYVRVDEQTAREHDYFCVAYAHGISPGYGWLFPGPDGMFNVGVGYVYGRSAPRERNVRLLLERFLQSFPEARHLMQGAQWTGPLRGAPIRTSLRGARLSRPGLLVVGEAAGLTYAFSGEGIGKSLQSGMLAASIIAEHAHVADAAARIASAYATTLRARFIARFRAYDRLQRLVGWPLLADGLVWRANAGRYVRRQLQSLLDESGSADELLTVGGIARAIFS